MNRPAPLAAAELERGARAVRADLVASQRHVRAARRQAGERALGGPGEQVVAGRQYRAAGAVSDLRAHRDQCGERRPRAGTIRVGEHLGGQVGEWPGRGGQQAAQPRHGLLVREQQRCVATGETRGHRIVRGAAQQRRCRIGRGGQAEVAVRSERPPQRPGREVHPLRADQVLACRVAVHPLEGGVEQFGGEVHHSLRMAADGGARGDRLERGVVLAAPDAFA